ncbi:MAG: hypothetical protein ACERKV_10455 [Clostridiaceae bacterium]
MDKEHKTTKLLTLQRFFQFLSFIFLFVFLLSSKMLFAFIIILFVSLSFLTKAIISFSNNQKKQGIMDIIVFIAFLILFTTIALSNFPLLKSVK